MHPIKLCRKYGEISHQLLHLNKTTISLAPLYDNYHIATRKQITPRENEGDLTQSYDKNPYTNRKFENNGQHKNATKTTITQRLRTNLGRSVEVATVIQLVWLNRLTGTQHSH